ncbi:MAG TPA: hypothetical protein VK939_12970 [Longimicrobiales bacterium]|nr:hypothetical protein [Longimicrobiales bacterium]
MLHLVAVALQQESTGFWARVIDFLDTPAPFSPFSEYLAVLFLLWLLARYEENAKRKKAFETQAQDVLDEKYASGELSVGAYEKFRQEVTMRLRR